MDSTLYVLYSGNSIYCNVRVTLHDFTFLSNNGFSVTERWDWRTCVLTLWGVTQSKISDLTTITESLAGQNFSNFFVKYPTPCFLMSSICFAICGHSPPTKTQQELTALIKLIWHMTVVNNQKSAVEPWNKLPKCRLSSRSARHLLFIS